MSTNIKIENVEKDIINKYKENKSDIFSEKENNINNKSYSNKLPENNNFDNILINESNIPHKYEVITRVIFIPKPTTLADILPFLFSIFVYGLLVQSLLSLWKRMHSGSHQICQILFVYFFPLFFLIFASDYLLMVMWFLLTIIITYCLVQIYCSQMTYKIPRNIFWIFKRILVITNISIFIAHVILFISFFKIESLIIFASRFFAYSIYFSVLCREIILNLSHVMAIRSGYFSKDGIPNSKDDNTRCMICTEELTDNKEIITLKCNHSYHTECIRGWSLVGQNKYCPYCKNGIDSNFFKLEFWDKTDLPFLPLMNLVRSFISFFIIIFIFFVYKTL